MKKLVVLLSFLVMLVSIFSGCNSIKEENSAKPTEEKTEVTNAPPAEDKVSTWDDEDLSWRLDTEPVEYSMFLDIAWAPMDVWGSDHVSQKITELTGVSFEVTKAQDAQHLSLLMNSGDYPDSIFVFTNKQFYENPDISYAWNDLIPEYCPEFMDLLDKSEIGMATKDDGNFYSLYTHTRNQSYWDDPQQPVSYGEPTIIIRDDLLAEIGNPKVETMDDFKAALKAVKDLHPDYTAYLQGSLNAGALLGWYGINAYSTFYTDDAGKLKYDYNDPDKYREYLTYLNSLKREGLLSVEGLTYDFDQQKQAILAGKVFATACQIFDVDVINEELDKIEGNTIKYTALSVPLKVGSETKYAPLYPDLGFAGYYITKSCEEPGRLIKLMEFMKSPAGDRLTQWGVEGVDYVLSDDGLPLINDDIPWKDRGDNVWYFGASFGVEIQKALTKRITSPDYSQVTDLMFSFKPFWSADFALGLCVPDAETPMYEIKSMIDQAYKDNINPIIAAETDEEFETLFAKMYSEFDRVGIAEYEAWAQKRYDEVKVRFE